MKIENRVSCEGNWKVSVVKQIHFYMSFFHRTRINFKFLQISTKANAHNCQNVFF